MAKIYLVRHAESIANTKGIYQGQTYDTGLSLIGKKQAETLALRFTKIPIIRIIASPLLRTKETAMAVSKVNGVEIFLEERIIETNHGEWEGKKKVAIVKRWKKTYQNWLDNPPSVKFPGGEAFADTQKRVLDWWQDVIKENEDVLVVTHDNIARIIIAEVLGLSFDSIWNFHLHPAALNVIEIENGEAKLKCLNDMEHLGSLDTNVAIHAL